MARKAKAEEHENLERWLVSYADFITLLFAFFVVMYSISSINEGKYRVLSDSLIAAFHTPNKTLAPIQVGKIARSPIKEKSEVKKSAFIMKIPEIPLPWAKDEKLKGAGPESHPSKGQVVDAVLVKLAKTGEVQLTARQQAALRKALKGKQKADGAGVEGGDDAVAMKKIAADVQRALQTLIEKHLIKVRRSKLWVQVEIKDSVLFASGQASINPKAVHVVRDLAKILAPFPNVVRVEGFTDNVPIHNKVYPSNWELSSARAASVVRLMIEHGIDPRRLLAVGYGKYHPIANNKTAAGRRKNRRVTLVVLAKGAGELALRADLANDGKPMNATDKRPAVPAGPSGEGTPVGAAAKGLGAGLQVQSGPSPAPRHPALAQGSRSRRGRVSGLQRVRPAEGRASAPGPVRTPIPPPIRLAPPIRLPLPLGRPMGSPLAIPDGTTGEQP